MNKNYLARLHEILDDEGIPRNGMAAPLTLVDRLIRLAEAYRTVQAAARKARGEEPAFLRNNRAKVERKDGGK